MRSKFALIFAALSFAASAQTAFYLPVSGLIHDPGTRSVRPILGLPGAAWTGAAVIEDVDWASARNGAALVSREGGLYLAGGEPVAGAIGVPDRISWSPDSDAAAIAAGNWVQILRGLNGSAVAETAVELEGIVVALLTDGGSAIAATETGAVYRIASGEPPLLLARVERPAALAASGADLFIADRAGRLFEIRDSDVIPFADAGLDPVGIAAFDGRLIVVGKAARRVAVYSVADRALEFEIPLDFEPEALEPMAFDWLFLLKGPKGESCEPVQVLTALGGIGIYFVPIWR